jgi:hypothetical protein
VLFVFGCGVANAEGGIGAGEYADGCDSWWIKRAAAYRDGIIHGSGHGITYDDEQAYAILMTGDQETGTELEGVIRYQAEPADPGRFKLLKNHLSKRPVRVLRSWKLDSKWAPKAGLRYDGLWVP